MTKYWRCLTLAALATSTGCAQLGLGGTAAPGGMPQTRVPDDPQGLLTAGAPNNTVRPARRDHSEALVRQLRVPAGFRVEVFAQGLENPRIIKVHPNGNVYVTEREAGRVALLRDTNGDGRADVVQRVATGLGQGMSGVHGLAIRDNQLWMVTEKELYRAPIRANGTLGERTRLMDDIPDGGQHPNRTMEFGPDGRLYLSIGSSTNAVPEPNEEHATLVRVSNDGKTRTIFARGLRNTIGFGWHPVNGRLYGWDHNSDSRGDDWPPEEINWIREGRHYGWPFCAGDRQVDPHVAQNPDNDPPRAQFCRNRTEGTALNTQAHAAGMQYVFYTGSQFPAEYRNDAFVTMRGSWNRNPAIGYEIARVRHDAAGNPIRVEPFVSGWLLEDGRAQFGRLTGLAVARDGSLLVANDSHGVIYRISYQR